MDKTWDQNHPAYISDARLIEKVVRGAIAPRNEGYHARWYAVRTVCLVGSTTARALCQRFDIDPDEEIRWDGKTRKAKQRTEGDAPGDVSASRNLTVRHEDEETQSL